MKRLAGIVLSIFLTATLSTGGERKPDFSSRHVYSPKGGWLVAEIGELRLDSDAPIPDLYTTVGQWIFRVRLDAKGSKAELLHRCEKIEESIQVGTVLDDGSVLAAQGDLIVLWDPAGKRRERRLTELGEGFAMVKAYPLGVQAHLSFIHRGKDEVVLENLRGWSRPFLQSAEDHYLLDPKTLALKPIRHAAKLADILDPVCWTADGKFLIGVQIVPGDRPSREEDGIPVWNDGHRLVRIDLKGGKRESISDQVWCRFRAGKTVIVWNQGEPGKKGFFWRAALAPPFDPKRVPALDAWDPEASLGGDQFLVRSREGLHRRIVDLAAFDGKKFESESKDFPFPPKVAAVDYSPALNAFVLKMGHFSVAIAGMDGAVRETVTLEREAAPSTK